MKASYGFESSILVVDDDLDLLDLICEELEPYFKSVLKAPHGAKALELMKVHRVDCLITDYRMPEMDGLELISHMSRLYPSLPVILLTGNGSDEKVVEATMTGLFDYIDKPYRTNVLVNRIRNALVLPKLESLVIDFARFEFPDLKIEKFVNLTAAERMKAVYQLDALIRTRLLARMSKESA